jgi:hypothetical protein
VVVRITSLPALQMQSLIKAAKGNELRLPVAE